MPFSPGDSFLPDVMMFVYLCGCFFLGSPAFFFFAPQGTFGFLFSPGTVFLLIEASFLLLQFALRFLTTPRPSSLLASLCSKTDSVLNFPFFLFSRPTPMPRSIPPSISSAPPLHRQSVFPFGLLLCWVLSHSLEADDRLLRDRLFSLVDDLVLGRFARFVKASFLRRHFSAV